MVKFFNLFLLTIWFVVVAVYLVCSAKVTYSQLAVSNGLSVPYMHVEFNDHLRYAGLYHFFGYLWTIAFFLAIMDIIIAGAVAHWYFTPARNGVKNLEVGVCGHVCCHQLSHYLVVAQPAVFILTYRLSSPFCVADVAVTHCQVHWHCIEEPDWRCCLWLLAACGSVVHPVGHALRHKEAQGRQGPYWRKAIPHLLLQCKPW